MEVKTILILINLPLLWESDFTYSSSRTDLSKIRAASSAANKYKWKEGGRLNEEGRGGFASASSREGSDPSIPDGGVAAGGGRPGLRARAAARGLRRVACVAGRRRLLRLRPQPCLPRRLGRLHLPFAFPLSGPPPPTAPRPRPPLRQGLRRPLPPPSPRRRKQRPFPRRPQPRL